MSRARTTFQSRPDLQGVKTRFGVVVWSPAAAFQSRPDLQGVKTFRAEHRASLAFQSRPDLQGVKTRDNPMQVFESGLPKQTRSSGGQNHPQRLSLPRPHLPKQTRSSGGQNSEPRFPRSRLAFQSRPDLQGLESRRPKGHEWRPCRRKADRQRVTSTPRKARPHLGPRSTRLRRPGTRPHSQRNRLSDGRTSPMPP